MTRGVKGPSGVDHGTKGSTPLRTGDWSSRFARRPAQRTRPAAARLCDPESRLRLSSILRRTFTGPGMRERSPDARAAQAYAALASIAHVHLGPMAMSPSGHFKSSYGLLRRTGVWKNAQVEE